MSPLFRRNSPAAASSESATAEPTPTPDKAVGKAATAGKGRPTPKRRDAQKRRTAEPPPKDSKEARKRMREKMRQERKERYEGARRGEDRYLLARDRGPVRRLVRDLIDARRNIGPLFFFGILFVLFFSTSTVPLVRNGANFLWFGLLALQILDSILISRLIKRAVTERFPDTKEKMRSLYLYGVLRSISFRKIRNPAPQVKVGDSV